MAERELTFKRYVVEEAGSGPEVSFWWRGLLGRPPDLSPERLLVSSGFTDTPLNYLVSGYLDEPWQGHPRQALIISTTTGFLPGERYAVSLEPGPAPREDGRATGPQVSAAGRPGQ
jgi:hypothetical protein